MVYVFIASVQLIIHGFAWMLANLMFKGSNLIPVVMLCAGVVIGFFSMFVMGWIF